MSMLDGISQCWVLSENCVIWWDAWAAIGTIGATVVALALGGKSQLQEILTIRKRRSVAIKLATSHLASIFNQTYSMACNPGISSGMWDDRIVGFVQTSADIIESACEAVEKCLVDMDATQSEVVSDVIADSHMIVAVIQSLDREPMERRVEIADYYAKNIYDRAVALLDKEQDVMSSLGSISRDSRRILRWKDR